MLWKESPIARFTHLNNHLHQIQFDIYSFFFAVENGQIDGKSKRMEKSAAQYKYLFTWRLTDFLPLLHIENSITNLSLRNFTNCTHTFRSKDEILSFANKQVLFFVYPLFSSSSSASASPSSYDISFSFRILHVIITHEV